MASNIEARTVREEIRGGYEYWRRVERVGPVVLAQASWGNRVESDKGSEGQGFNHCWQYPPDVNLFSGEAQNRQAVYGAELVESAMELRDLYGIEELVVATNSMTGEGLGELRVRLEGLGVGRVRHFHLACAGGVDAMCRLASEYQGREGVGLGVLSIESIGGSQVDDESVRKTFGNGAVATVWRAGEIEVLRSMAQVEHDRGESMKTPRTLPVDLGELGERLDPSGWYEVVGEETNEFFRETGQGVFLLTPESDLIEMDGRGLISFFSESMAEMILEMVGSYDGEYGPLGYTVSHQPSEPVVRKINRNIWESLGYSRLQIRELERKTPDEIVRELELRVGVDRAAGMYIPWVMEGSGFRNISPGTAMVAWSRMANELDMFEVSRPVLMVGFGIGGVRSVNVLKVNG